MALERLSPFRVLTVNGGSTSVKVVRVEGGRAVGHHDRLEEVLASPPDGIDAVVHRVVHGGARTGAALVDHEVLEELRGLTELAPLHQPGAVDGIEASHRAWPEVPQIACFDTAFHATIPVAARTYALPTRMRSTVRGFGFHGLSVAWAARRLAQLAPACRRVVVAHLGGGQSLTGMLDGRSRTTTMGFTPLDGLVMATRCGALDPGAVLWLAANTAEDLPTVLERESGLLGLCGSADLGEVLERRDRGDESAVVAVEVYLHRFVHELGGCVADIGGLDALVFTGGIGEHLSALRVLVAERLGWLGVDLVADAPGEEITASTSAVRIFVIESREDLQMAQEARAVLSPL